MDWAKAEPVDVQVAEFEIGGSNGNPVLGGVVDDVLFHFFHAFSGVDMFGAEKGTEGLRWCWSFKGNNFLTYLVDGVEVFLGPEELAESGSGNLVGVGGLDAGEGGAIRA